MKKKVSILIASLLILIAISAAFMSALYSYYQFDIFQAVHYYFNKGLELLLMGILGGLVFTALVMFFVVLRSKASDYDQPKV